MAQVVISEYPLVDTGDYPVVVKDVNEETGQYGPQIKLTLEIVGNSEFAGQTLTTWAGLSASMKGKLYQYAAAMGIELEAGDVLDTDDLQGRKCMASVVVTPKKDGSGEFSKVVALKAPKVKKNGSTPKPAPKTEPAEDEIDYDPFA